MTELPPPPPVPSPPPPALSHLRTATGALVGWWRAVTLDALIVGVLWLVGLELLGVPWAPVWALIGGVCQFVPGIGGMLALIGPTLATAFAGGDDMLFHISMVLGLYAAIIVLEGLAIQPYILHRTTMVPWWASLLGPVMLGILIPPWGVLIAPPLLAIGFAFKRRSDLARRNQPSL